jgi:hypothetical protein
MNTRWQPPILPASGEADGQHAASPNYRGAIWNGPLKGPSGRIHTRTFYVVAGEPYWVARAAMKAR